jgi:hypothetical protein
LLVVDFCCVIAECSEHAARSGNVRAKIATAMFMSFSSNH